MKLKNLLANKNVVTILGVVLIVIVLYAFYMWRVNAAINPISVPYAKVTIGPRTQVTNDMIGTLDIQPSAMMGDVLTNVNTQIVGMYTNINCTIPAGSLFYNGMLVRFEELADSFLIDMPKDVDGNYMQAYDFDVSINTTYGNSIYPGNYIDIYFIRKDSSAGSEKVLYGKLVSNVKVLAVKDSNGNHVFENMNENRAPSQIICAVTDEMLSLLRVAETLSGSELILVPTNISYRPENTEEIITEISDEDIKAYIESSRAN